MLKIFLMAMALTVPAGAQSGLPAVVDDPAISDNFNYLYESFLGLNGKTVDLSPYLRLDSVFSGDVSGTYNATSVADNSHNHGDSTLTGMAASKLTGALPAISGALVTDVVHSTDSLVASVASLGGSTWANHQDILAETSARQYGDSGIYSALGSTASALTAETGRATARENSIAVSTGSIYSALSSTGSALTAESVARIAGDSSLDVAKVNRAGDTIHGQITITSSLTITGSASGYGLSVSSNVYIVGFSSATKYYGDGSSLTGVATSAISTVTIDALPIGSFIQYGSTTPPSSYLYCDGTSYSTTTYSALFSVIGYKYGGSGANFTCDFRGMFARGLDTTGTIDSEPRVIGSTELDDFKGHTHSITDPGHIHQLNETMGFSPYATWPDIGRGASASANYTRSALTGISILNSGGVETRPKNVAVAVMVKYRTALDVVYTTNTVGPLVTSSTTYSGQNTFTNSVTASSFTATNATINFTSTPTFSTGIIPFTMTVKTSGTGTYAVPAGVRQLLVKMVGGGGGGGAGANAGVSGGNGASSTFGTSLLTANGGYGGCTNSDETPNGCSSGGAATINAPAVGWAVVGGFGGSGASIAGQGMGGSGGNSPLGGGGFGKGGTNVGPSTGVGVANTGGGGGGGGSYGFTYAASGGGAGGYIEAIIKNPSGSYNYAVGSGGTAGGSGAGGGAAGGSGIIIIYEYY